MAIHNLSAWQHNHVYDPGNLAGERRTWIVVGITAATLAMTMITNTATTTTIITTTTIMRNPSRGASPGLSPRAAGITT